MEHNKYYDPSYKGEMAKKKLSIDERFKLYIETRLPGQGLVTFMGTYYLMNDLKAEVDRLRARNAELEARLNKTASDGGTEGAQIKYEETPFGTKIVGLEDAIKSFARTGKEGMMEDESI
jgi:hypothetical protein